MQVGSVDIAGELHLLDAKKPREASTAAASSTTMTCRPTASVDGSWLGGVISTTRHAQVVIGSSPGSW